MRRLNLFLSMTTAIGLVFALSGCTQKPAEARVEKPVVTINKLQLTGEEVKQEINQASLAIHEAVNTKEAEPEWLSSLIERELLVQEAQRLGLDRQPDFMRTIERFWKEALIKLLLNRKGQEIGDQVHVYEPEIEAYYKKLASEQTDTSQPLAPLSELREVIRREIREQKETEAMDNWIAELKKKAEITVDREAISKLG